MGTVGQAVCHRQHSGRNSGRTNPPTMAMAEKPASDGAQPDTQVGNAYYYKAAKRVVDAVTGVVHLRPLYNAEMYDFKAGGTYTTVDVGCPVLCGRGFHACKHPAAIVVGFLGFKEAGGDQYYDSNDALLRVRLFGETDTDGVVTAGTEMYVDAVISWAEAFEACGLSWQSPITSKLYTFDYEGKLHSWNDMPAVHSSHYGYAMWCNHGRTHRDGDKPAVVSRYRKEWYIDGELHRGGNQPAVMQDEVALPKYEASDEFQEWYHRGVCYGASKSGDNTHTYWGASCSLRERPAHKHNLQKS